MSERVAVGSIRGRLPILVLLLAVLVAHGGALRAGFLYDDYHLIAENPAVLTHAWGLIWTSSEAASRDPQGRGFRPATLSSYAIDHVVGGGRPAVYHATQVVLHAAVVWLVYLVAMALGLSPGWAAASALMAALHPVQTEAVHYLSARSSVLSTLWLLASFCAYLRWREQETSRRTWRALSLGFLALAVLSKESAVMGLVWFVAYERLVAAATLAESVRRLGLHAATAVLSVAPAVLAVNHAVSGAFVSTDMALATGLVLLGRHLWDWVVLFGVEPVSPQPWVGWDQPVVWGAAALIGGVCGVGYAFRQRLPLVAWGIATGVSALLPVMALPFVTNVALFQPHRGYQATVGLAVAVVAAAEALARRVPAMVRSAAAQRWLRKAAWTLGGAVVVALVITNAQAGRAWRDEVGFWTAAVDKYPSKAAYHQSLGAARLRASDASGAVEALTAASRLDPLLPRVDFNLGLGYAKLGRYAEAVAAYERAVGRDPTDVKALANLGALYERSGAMDRAARVYRAALAVSPGLVAVQARLNALSEPR
ncbi:MAG: tetratricopeptide repeat protein [Nitrospirota bacterium]